MILNNAKNMMLGSRQIDRILFGGNILWGLPKGYRRCKYLVFSAKQRFKIDSNMYANDMIVSVSKNSGAGGYNTIWGVYNNAELYYYSAASEGVRMYYSNAAIESTADLGYATKVICKAKANVGRNYYVGDLGADNGSYMFRGKLYGFSILRDGAIAVNLIPCLNADGVPCLYDTVSKATLYQNSSRKGVCGYELMDGTYAAPI